jgi:hypothetical protein
MDPHLFVVDPNPAFSTNADPDPATGIQVNADPDLK